jgi:hypothetical protein
MIITQINTPTGRLIRERREGLRREVAEQDTKPDAGEHP